MDSKIYRNGKNEREATSKILLKNTGVFLIPFLMALAIVKWLHGYWGYENNTVDVSILSIFISAGFLGYIYRTLTRIRPLAFKNGNLLVINSGLLFRKKIDLSQVKKITCQFITEHDQLMKVKIPGEVPIIFEIKQTDCSTEDLGEFITQNHNIDISYS